MDLAELDLGYLGAFVGLAWAEAVERALTEAGLSGLRAAHGFLVQHLVEGERTIGELAERLEVTPQAASKAVNELVALGYVSRTIDAGDARIRRVALSETGWKAVETTRRARAEVEARVAEALGAGALSATKAGLLRALEALGAVERIRGRRVRDVR